MKAWIVLLGVIGAVFVLLFLIRNKVWQWPRLELVGYGVWLLAGGMFAVPEIWASRDSDLPFPTLSGTIGHLERRWEIVSLFVMLVIANALLHGVRLGAAVIARRIELAGPTGSGPPEAVGADIAAIVQLKPGKHVAVDDGRFTRAPAAVRLGWGFGIAYFICTCAVVAFSFLIPFWIHGSHATDAEKQLAARSATAPWP